MNSKINKESLLAIFLTDNNYQKIHYYEFPIIKELKWRNGAKTKYEIPQFINDVPEDFPVFCTIKEAGMIKNYQNKMKKKEDKNKKNKSDLKSKEKEKEKEKEKNNNNSKNDNTKKNDNNNILDEPIPNEIHKYCHLCKKHFDNYMRHINTKIHKDNTNKYSDTFKNIKNIFKRINTYWDDKKKNNKNKNENEIKNNNNDNIRNNDEDFEDDNFKFKIFSQFNQNIKEGCKAKKKILIGQNSQLSTAQSFPVIPPKKRKKNDVKNITNKSKDKKNKSNKNINEFLINGEFINIKKLNRNEINFYNNYYN